MARQFTSTSSFDPAPPMIVAATGAATAVPARVGWRELTKARLSALVVLTTAFGFLLSVDAAFSLLALFVTLAGTALVAVSSSALNQLYESQWDALMARTAGRPLPTGQFRRAKAWWFAGITFSLGSLLLLWVEPLAAALAATTLVIYVWIYTPLKRHTTLNTLVGAIPGAIPPLIGWAAAQGTLSLNAWSLFAILFCWQIPHFLAIAWLHREDYARAGFRMLSVGDDQGRRTGRMAVQYLLALIVISMFPYWIGFAGGYYVMAASVLGVLFLGAGVHMAIAPSRQTARRLFFASLLYLPLLLTSLMFDLQPSPALDPRVKTLMEAGEFTAPR